MSSIDIVRAWKDEAYRNSLTAEQQALMPDHPAGLVELNDELLGTVDGGSGIECVTLVTFIVSCSVSCPSLFQGSCAFLSIGCC